MNPHNLIERLTYLYQLSLWRNAESNRPDDRQPMRYQSLQRARSAQAPAGSCTGLLRRANNLWCDRLIA